MKNLRSPNQRTLSQASGLDNISSTQVPPDFKLPVLYLVDSIIKNVGGAYILKFAQIIVNMFTKTFKQVDEKIRSQMFKLRETWHDVFPSTKLYQLDVKVNLIDPAWPIQAQPHQSNIHVKPSFLKKPTATTSTSALTEEEESMRAILAKKEQELLMLQRKKVEMELEQTMRQLQQTVNNHKMSSPVPAAGEPPAPSAPTAPTAEPLPPAHPVASEMPVPAPSLLSIKQRLGPPVNKSSSAGRITPVSGALAAARRDPRLARRSAHQALPARPAHPAPLPAAAHIAPHVFDIKPLHRATKRNAAITIEVTPDAGDPRIVRPRHRKQDRRGERDREKVDTASDNRGSMDAYIDRLQIPDPERINRLPPIPKMSRSERDDPPQKRKKEPIRERKKRRDAKDGSGLSHEKRQKLKEKDKKAYPKDRMEVDDKQYSPEVVSFKELKNCNKKHYMRRNEEKSESPDRLLKEEEKPSEESTNPPEIVGDTKDVDLRVLHSVTAETAAPIAQKRPSTETVESRAKKNKLDKFDILFGNEDVDLRQLPQVPPDFKLPVLYLVDSIIKNVGGAYILKFAQIIVNMFTKTFKQVDEKIRSQMFKLRETWHDVFPSTKLYQLDVKVNLIDPAWPIQAQPHQSNIHVKPSFLKKPTATTSTSALTEEEESMRAILAKKEQELLMLQRKKVEMELEQTMRQLQQTVNNHKMSSPVPAAGEPPAPSAPTAPTAEPLPPAHPVASEMPVPAPSLLSIKQRLGPPVNKSSSAGRITPVSGALAAARRDPRLARRSAHQALPARPAHPAPLPAAAHIAPHVFDIKPLHRATKRNAAITIEVTPDAGDPRIVRPRHRKQDRRGERDREKVDTASDNRGSMDAYIDRLQIPDPERINRLPPIPKMSRSERDDPPQKRKKEPIRERKKRRDAKDGSGLSHEKRQKLKEKDKKAYPKDRMEVDDKQYSPEVVSFKELKNCNKKHYMRRNEEKSESPDRLLKEEEKPSEESTNPPEIVGDTKDVDLRVLHSVTAETAAPIAQKRPSTETAESRAKKNKLDKFDILFGNEDVDLRQLPQVEEATAPPPPSISEANSVPKDEIDPENSEGAIASPARSPRKDWQEVKEKEETKKTPSKLDLVRAKLAEATKVKDGLGRPLLFSKSPSVERERRRTFSSDEIETKTDSTEEFDAGDHKKTISIIMNQAKEQLSDGQLYKNQYNILMYQVLQLNEKLKLKETKQRESLEVSKRKLKAHVNDDNKVPSPKSSPSDRNRFGDIDERVALGSFADPENQNNHHDSDMRVNHHGDSIDGNQGGFPMPPMMPPMYMGPFPMWRGLRPRMEEFGPRRFRGPIPPYFRGKFDKRGPRPPFDMRMPLLPTPKLGMCQGECPLQPYERSTSPPPLGTPGYNLPPTDYKILEYINQDPVKTIQIDGIPREIRFYGETAIIMLDWDDPRVIKFLPGCRRVTFDNKNSVVLSFNEGYKKVEIDDQVFDIRFGAPTRELYINGRWYECFFGGQPLGVIIDGKPRLVHLEGPLPQVDIGKTKRTDLVAGKINLIINATNICPVYLDAKVQKFHVNGQFFTIRFVDSLRTALINEKPFKVEYGDLPKPIFVGGEKYFVRFSSLPKNIKPGQVEIADMEGNLTESTKPEPVIENENVPMETDFNPPIENHVKPPSPEGEMKGLDMLANFMPSDMVPASSSEYSSAEPLFTKPEFIPGLETPVEEKSANALPLLGNINVNDLFAKLVATGIVPMLNKVKPEAKIEVPEIEETKHKPREDKTVIHKVDLLKPETLRIKQRALVVKLYSGMQCSGCGARFPPEHTVRYSQHLDWHFRQNRRERDSARRAHSRHWHYDLSDWLLYEELEDLEEREKSWFETGGSEEAPVNLAEAVVEESPSAAAGGALQHNCALCGDRFHQFYNEDQEEWHLRNAVKHQESYYHPLCLQDYKASLTKEEPPVEEPTVEVEDEPQEEAIEIGDAAEVSDTESVVEVLETEMLEPVEIEVEEEGEEDDVVLNAEPVEQVEVEDDDTDDETVAQRAERDQQVKIDFAKVKIKQEPIDSDDEPIITAEVESIPPTIDLTHTTVTTVTSSIDGNVQFDNATLAHPLPLGGIRINISKTISNYVAKNHKNQDKAFEDVSTEDEPTPPGEEVELEYELKPSLKGVQFTKQPPVQRGSELSGLCCIM